MREGDLDRDKYSWVWNDKAWYQSQLVGVISSHINVSPKGMFKADNGPITLSKKLLSFDLK